MPEPQVTDLAPERTAKDLERLLGEAETAGLDLLDYLIDMALAEAQSSN